MDEAKTFFSMDKQGGRTVDWDKPQRGLMPSCSFSPSVSSSCLPRQEGLGRESCHLDTSLVKRHLMECPGKM